MPESGSYFGKKCFFRVCSYFFLNFELYIDTTLRDNHAFTGKTLKLRIRHKLFLSTLLTSSIMAGGIFLFLQWSFDRDFLGYVNSQEFKHLNTMAEKLPSYYSKEAGWEGLQGNHRLWTRIQRNIFFDVMRESVDKKLFADRPQQPPHPPMDPIRLGKRIVLLDLEKNRVIGGPPEQLTHITTIPITSAGSTIGFLGLFPISEISDSGDLLFVKQQKQSFALIALMMLGVSIILTFPITIHLLRPVNHLTEGTRKLIGGKFVTRIPITSGDELGRLSEHFNMLAMTLEKNEKARQRWIADISHELRTPISILRGELEALLDGVRKTGIQTLTPLLGEVLHMQRLVNDLYELSMSDIGALTYKKVLVDPVGILDGTIELLEKRYADKGMELHLQVPAGMSPPLLGDPDRLQQLFTNLLENSLRYTDSPGMLEILTERSEERIVLLFQDTEPGVAADQLPLLFDRLYRTDLSRHRANNGAGLGLAICTNIVEAHQGKISSYASPYGGLGIRVELPITS